MSLFDWVSIFLLGTIRFGFGWYGVQLHATKKKGWCQGDVRQLSRLPGYMEERYPEGPGRKNISVIYFPPATLAGHTRPSMLRRTPVPILGSPPSSPATVYHLRLHLYSPASKRHTLDLDRWRRLFPENVNGDGQATPGFWKR